MLSFFNLYSHLLKKHPYLNEKTNIQCDQGLQALETKTQILFENVNMNQSIQLSSTQ